MMKKILWSSLLLTWLVYPITAVSKHAAQSLHPSIESSNGSSPPQLLQESELDQGQLRRYAQADLADLKDELAAMVGYAVDKDPRVYLGSFRTALDYHNPANSIEVELNYLIHYAKDQPEDKPTLWLHYGGPGFSTLLQYVFDDLNDLVWPDTQQAAAHMDYDDDDHFRDFNVVLLEPRMTGYSGLSNLFTVDEPDFPLFQLSAAAANTQIPRFGKYYSTNTYVEDVERLRQWLAQGTADRIALKTEKIHLFGMSYGAVAYAYYANQYPEHVASLILDSVPDLVNTPPDTLVQISREISGLDNSPPKEIQKDAGADAIMHIKCSDLGFVQVDTLTRDRDRVNGSFYNQVVCQHIQPDLLANLANSATLKQLNFPVLMFSTQGDTTTPLPIQQHAFEHVFARQGIHIIYDGHFEYKHANLRSLLEHSPIRQQIIHYMLQPNSILDHVEAFADHVCTYQTRIDQTSMDYLVDETHCLPTMVKTP